jgi:dGTPase
MKESSAAKLCKALKAFDFKHGYKHRSVLALELEGYNVIRGLMDIFWQAIRSRNDFEDITSIRTNPKNAYVYGRISENYRRVFLRPENNMPIAYKEAQLLSDMISGMTDSYALSLYKELKAFD